MPSANNAVTENAWYKCLKDGSIRKTPNDKTITGTVKKGKKYRVDAITKNGKHLRIYNQSSSVSNDEAKASDHKKVGWVLRSDFERMDPILPVVDVLTYSKESTSTVKSTSTSTGKSAATSNSSNNTNLNNSNTSNSIITNRQRKEAEQLFFTSMGSASTATGVYLNDFVKTIENSGLMLGPNDAKYKYLNQFARMNFNDAYNFSMSGVKEFLFFVKPDLNIIKVSDKGAGSAGDLVKSLSVDSFFVDLVKNHPDVVKALQFSLDRVPFTPLLSATCRSPLELPNIDGEVMDGPANVYGTSIEYRQGGEKSDENYSFSLEFRETKNLDIYYFCKAYEMYEQKKKLGLLKPKYNNYISYKVLYDQMGIYKFTISEDMHTIIHYAYLCGVKPMNVPRSAFSSPDIKPLEYSIDFKAEFIEDTNPAILRDFNVLMQLQRNHYGANRIIKPYDFNNDMINGEWAYGAEVKIANINGKDRFVMEWYGMENRRL